jgi:hypothetical protein
MVGKAWVQHLLLLVLLGCAQELTLMGTRPNIMQVHAGIHIYPRSSKAKIII